LERRSGFSLGPGVRTFLSRPAPLWFAQMKVPRASRRLQDLPILEERSRCLFAVLPRATTPLLAGRLPRSSLQ
jgi:hypothetical protein